MNSLTIVEQKLVLFDDAELLCVKTNDGKIRVGVAYVCNGIGLSDKQKDRQVSNIQEDVVLQQAAVKLPLKFGGQVREVLTLELDFLPLWLAKISITPNMVEHHPEVTRKLIEYQLRAKDALAEAFLQRPKTQLELLQATINQLVEQERRITAMEARTAAMERKLDTTSELLALHPVEWRKKVTRILNKIAQARGGHQEAYQDVRTESYEILEERAACNLSIRLTNRKRKMALEGAPKSKIDKASKLDVIADDARLTEIYLAVVKEMAIRYAVDLAGEEDSNEPV